MKQKGIARVEPDGLLIENRQFLATGIGNHRPESICRTPAKPATQNFYRPAFCSGYVA